MCLRCMFNSRAPIQSAGVSQPAALCLRGFPPHPGPTCLLFLQSVLSASLQSCLPSGAAAADAMGLLLPPRRTEGSWEAGTTADGSVDTLPQSLSLVQRARQDPRPVGSDGVNGMSWGGGIILSRKFLTQIKGCWVLKAFK